MVNSTKQNWDDLTGRQVQLWKNGDLIRCGYVEAVAPAVAGLWLRGDGVDRRALYERADGYTAVPVTALDVGAQTL